MKYDRKGRRAGQRISGERDCRFAEVAGACKVHGVKVEGSAKEACRLGTIVVTVPAQHGDGCIDLP